MCGICGKISDKNGSNVNADLLKKMCSVLRHRGPDDEGIYVSPREKAALGHRRLSIIDLSSAGRQPMSNEDGSIWITMNGEIYNFAELREDLQQKGHRFRSHTDIETVLHLYEEKGTDCLGSLRGAFAFAIWDGNKRRLFAARDRLGKKPFCYFYKDRTLIFASEIKAIIQDPEVRVEVNRPAITDYLSYGYTPAPSSMFKGVMKLPPAHFMIYENGSIKIERYWQLDFSKKIKLSEPEYCERILKLLEDATRIRLVSDVPFGAFLSGGIDSSAVVYMMSRLMSGKVKTFSIGFQEEPYNELKYARLIAERFGTEHHEYIVKPEAVELLPKLVWHYNEPFADSSALPSFYVAKMTRQEVKVALNGDGGDENFGGYERFMAARYAEFLLRMPLWARTAVLKTIAGKKPLSADQKNLGVKLRRFTSAAALPYRERHYNWMAIFKDGEKAGLFTEGFKKELGPEDSAAYLYRAFEAKGVKDVVDLVMAADIRTNLPDDLLVKMDIATMANSMEGRSPFLDHEMMEFSASIPSRMKIKGLRLKYILKKSLSKILPAEILSRGKSGFAAPVSGWFRGDIKDYSREILMSERSIKRGYFKKETVEKLLAEHASGKADNGAKLWSLLNLELWHRIFIDREAM